MFMDVVCYILSKMHSPLHNYSEIKKNIRKALSMVQNINAITSCIYMLKICTCIPIRENNSNNRNSDCLKEQRIEFMLKNHWDIL